MSTEKNSFMVSFIKTCKQHSLFQFTDLELEGFIHTLSPIKKANNKSKTPYFECLVQTSNASKVRALCDETRKQTTLHQAYSAKSPVKISGVKRQPSTSFSDSLEEYKIAKLAKITSTMTEFDYNPDVASSIYSVQQALDGDLYKTIDVTAKVVNKEIKQQTTNCFQGKTTNENSMCYC